MPGPPRRPVWPVLLAATMLAATLSTRAEAAPIRVGVGRADITWHVGAERLGPVTSQVPDLAGQDVPADPLTFAGVHSRVEAKAVVVEAAQRFAFVRADILLVTGDLYEAVAVRVERATGIPPERLLLAATHTHVANNGLFPHFVHGALYRSPDPREKEFIAGRIADAVVRATQSLRPAALAVGSGSVMIPALNRRYTDREQLGRAPFANDPSRLDPELGVLRFDDAETGEPIAVMMNYGLHPVVLINNPLVSSDFVGLTERRVEQEFGVPMAIWFTGAQGDQDPVFVRYSYPEAEWTARWFADEATRVARDLVPEPLTGAAIAEQVIPLPPPGEDPIPSSEILGPRLPITAPAPLLIPSSARLQAISLSTASQSTALLSWPGEPIRDLGMDVKTRARALGFDRAFVLGLANDWGGYWLTPEEYDRGLYERTLMFYGRTSALYVSDHLIDLAASLRPGGPAPEPVSLPPQAIADRALTRAIAEAGYATRDPQAAAVLAIPDGPPAVVANPVDVARGGLTSFTWRGGSPDVASDWIPRVALQRRAGEAWVDVAREGTGEILLHQSTPALRESRWRALWQPTLEAPAGVHRFHVDGKRRTPAGDEPYTVDSEPFEVTACACIEPTPLAVGLPSGSGPITVSVSAAYAAPPDGFRLLPENVTTGVSVVEALEGNVVVGTVSLVPTVAIVQRARTITVYDLSGRDLPVTIVEPVEVATFTGTWSGSPGVTFRLVRVQDASGNRSG